MGGLLTLELGPKVLLSPEMMTRSGSTTATANLGTGSMVEPIQCQLQRHHSTRQQIQPLLGVWHEHGRKTKYYEVKTFIPINVIDVGAYGDGP